MKRSILVLAAIVVTSFALAHLFQEKDSPVALDTTASAPIAMDLPDAEAGPTAFTANLTPIQPGELDLGPNSARPIAAVTDDEKIIRPKFPIASSNQDRLAMIELFGPENSTAGDAVGKTLDESFAGPEKEQEPADLRPLPVVESTPAIDRDSGFQLDQVDVTPRLDTEVQSPIHPFVQQEVAPQQPGDAAAALKPGQDLIEMAGGAIQFPVDQDQNWEVKELPIGREIRVLLLPDQTSMKEIHKDEIDAGIWLTHHVNRSGSLSPEKLLDQREEELGENLKRVSRENIELAGHPAILDDVTIDEQRRIMIAVQTEWGLAEIQAWAPRKEFKATWNVWQPMLEEIHIGLPRRPQHANAKVPLGLWKSHHGYVHFLPDGRLKLAEDSTVVIGFEKQFVKKEKPQPPLLGQFQVDGDLLRIEWSDGTKLNYRWNVVDDQLRLTDNLGRIARLRRIYF